MSPHTRPARHPVVALLALVAASVLAVGCLAAAPSGTHARTTPTPLAKQTGSGVMHLCHGGTFCVEEPEEPVSRPAPAPYQACARRVPPPSSVSERVAHTVV